MEILGLILIIALFALIGRLIDHLNALTHPDETPLIREIENLLPQTQCGQCGYPGCKPFAKALSLHEARIDQCPPGGSALIHALSDLLGKDPSEAIQPEMPKARAPLAFIIEEQCIGCALCLKACPVDAILGAPRYLHTVIAKECTGCELCLPSCPVDCIELRPSRPFGTS